MNVWVKETIIQFATRRAIPGFSRYFGGHFNVCPINDAKKILKSPDNQEVEEILHAFHCVSWFQIPKELRKAIPNLIAQALVGDAR